MATLNEFTTYVKQGLAKGSHFMVNLNLPPSLNGMDPFTSNMKKIILFCDRAQIPGINYMSNQVRTYGEYREVPYEKVYDPVTLGFYVDVDMHVKLLFDSWMDKIQDNKTRDFNWPTEYLSDKIDIYVEDSKHLNRYLVTLNRCYPKSVASIQLDYAARDVMKLDVTLSYQFATYTQIQQSQKTEDFALSPQKFIGDYNYAYPVKVPSEYYNDFFAYQKFANEYDFTFDGAKNAMNSFEDASESTGYGGLFGP